MSVFSMGLKFNPRIRTSFKHLLWRWRAHRFCNCCLRVRSRQSAMTARAALHQPWQVLMLLTFGPYLISPWEARGFCHLFRTGKGSRALLIHAWSHRKRWRQSSLTLEVLKTQRDQIYFSWEILMLFFCFQDSLNFIISLWILPQFASMF